jgi:hypothetical protein
MRRARAALALSGFTLLAACSDNQPALPPKPASQEKLTRFEFKIGGVQYALSLPERAAMRDVRDGVVFYASRTQRLQRTMTITAASGRPNHNFDRTHLVRDEHGRPIRDRADRNVRYRHLGNVGAGSGGAIEDIAGRIQIGEIILFFECSDQNEATIHAEWCLDYIDSLDVIAPPASGNG